MGAANVLLGINQGLTWSMTVVMKIDLVGPRRRGLALGLNEAAGYGGVAIAAATSGWLASDLAAREVLVVAGAVIAVAALVASALFVRDTAEVVHEPCLRARAQAGLPPARSDQRLAQGGRALVGSGLRVLLLERNVCTANGASVGEVGLVAGLYPAVWGIAQIATGGWSDRAGRKPLIVAGMLVQALALGLLALTDGAATSAAFAAVVLGLGTALVYPTLIAAISDQITPVARAPVVGVLPLLARRGLRRRRSDRGSGRRRDRLRWRDRRRRGAHSVFYWRSCCGHDHLTASRSTAACAGRGRITVRNRN